jgi:hypothetical protein
VTRLSSPMIHVISKHDKMMEATRRATAGGIKVMTSDEWKERSTQRSIKVRVRRTQPATCTSRVRLQCVRTSRLNMDVRRNRSSYVHGLISNDELNGRARPIHGPNPGQPGRYSMSICHKCALVTCTNLYIKLYVQYGLS